MRVIKYDEKGKVIRSTDSCTKTNELAAAQPQKNKETEVKAVTNQVKVNIPEVNTEPWKKYMPKIDPDKQKKKTSPVDAEQWKKYMPKIDPDKQKKKASPVDAEQWKKYMPKVDPDQRKKNTPTVDTEQWKKYVPKVDPDQWKKNLSALGSSGGKYNPVGSFKITLPPVENFNLFKMADITAPNGVTIGIKMPFPMNESIMNKLGDYIRNAGGEMVLGNSVQK